MLRANHYVYEDLKNSAIKVTQSASILKKDNVNILFESTDATMCEAFMFAFKERRQKRLPWSSSLKYDGYKFIFNKTDNMWRCTVEPKIKTTCSNSLKGEWSVVEDTETNQCIKFKKYERPVNIRYGKTILVDVIEDVADEFLKAYKTYRGSLNTIITDKYCFVYNYKDELWVPTTTKEERYFVCCYGDKFHVCKEDGYSEDAEDILIHNVPKEVAEAFVDMMNEERPSHTTTWHNYVFMKPSKDYRYWSFKEKEYSSTYSFDVFTNGTLYVTDSDTNVETKITDVSGYGTFIDTKRLQELEGKELKLIDIEKIMSLSSSNINSATKIALIENVLSKENN